MACELNIDDLNAAERKKFDGYEIYKETKLANALFAKELSERLKDTNITVNVADPGRTKTELSRKMDDEVFFLSRWILGFVSFCMGERKVVKAVRPILYALCDQEMEGKTGDFINRERKEQPWNETVLDVAKRQRLWATSEAWTRLPTQMALLRNELGEPLDTASSPSSGAKSGKSWWRLLW
ncbi:unnamed protein product, partial [Mesorhabditis spiculigera]